MSRSYIFIFFAFICFSIFCDAEKNNVNVTYESKTIGSAIDNSINAIINGSKYAVASAIISFMRFYTLLKNKAYGTVEWAEETTKNSR